MEPNDIASQITQAVNDTAESQKEYADIERERLDLERQRIRTEERIMERQAERDEKVAEIQHDTNYYRSMLDELIGRIDNYFSGLGNQELPPISINTEHHEESDPSPENEVSAATEDSGGIEEELNEEVEEIGKEADKPAKELEEEITNAEPRRTGRKRRRGKR